MELTANGECAPLRVTWESVCLRGDIAVGVACLPEGLQGVGMPACHLGLLGQGSANSFCTGQEALGFGGHKVYHVFLVLVVAAAAGASSLFLLLQPFRNAKTILSLRAIQNQAIGWLWA